MNTRDVIRVLKHTSDLWALKEDPRAIHFERLVGELERSQADIEDLVASSFQSLRMAQSMSHVRQDLCQFVQTGQFAPLEEAGKDVPLGVLQLFKVRGLGPKRIRLLWDAGIDSPQKLLEQAQSGQLSAIKGFGSKTQKSIAENVAFMLGSMQTARLPEAQRTAQVLFEVLACCEPQLTGELRRACDTISSVDFLVSATEVPMPDLVPFDGGWTGTLHNVPFALYVRTPEPGIQAAFLSSGPWEHFLVQHAKEKGLDLSWQGLFQDGRHLGCATEGDLYRHLGVPNLPVEYREEAHLSQGLSFLEALPGRDAWIQKDDIKGFLHIHSHHSDGTPSIRQWADAVGAHEGDPRGHYLGLGDHSVSAFYARGLSIERLRHQWREIEELQREGYRILKGAEVDILRDGSLDYPDDILAELDYVVASVHSHFGLSETEQTERLIRAVSHPLVDILGHPTGRLLIDRPAYALDIDAVLACAAETQTAIEINANPHRLDLSWQNALRWPDLQFAINSDAHVLGGQEDLHYGVLVSHKAGIKRSQVVNSLGMDEFKAWVNRRRLSAKLNEKFR